MSNLFTIKLCKTNCYLLTIKDGYLLIDAGTKHICPSHGKPFGANELSRNIHALSIEGMGEFVWDQEKTNQ